MALNGTQWHPMALNGAWWLLRSSQWHMDCDLPDTSRDVHLLKKGELGYESLGLGISVRPTAGLGVHPWRRIEGRRVREIIPGVELVFVSQDSSLRYSQEFHDPRDSHDAGTRKQGHAGTAGSMGEGVGGAPSLNMANKPAATAHFAMYRAGIIDVAQSASQRLGATAPLTSNWGAESTSIPVGQRPKKRQVISESFIPGPGWRRQTRRLQAKQAGLLKYASWR